MGETLYAYRIKSTVTKAVTCQVKHTNKTARIPKCARMHQHTRMHSTQQYAHPPAMIRYLTTAPVMQHLKSTSRHRAISPVACHREERRETQAEKK